MSGAVGSAVACRICGNGLDNRPFAAREMMFGKRDRFEYFECGSCGALQLINPPGDMSSYYPSGYYSLGNQVNPHLSRWKRFLKRARGRYAIEGKGLLGRWLDRHQGHWSYFDWFREAGVRLDASILDVGCGRGDFLLRFASDGFRSLTGIDPYVDADIHYECGVHIYRRRLEEMTGTFDCILARHSLEHMPDPVESIRLISTLLKDGGVTLIAIPVAGCWAWRHYQADWYQLDAPRHLVIPSARSMEILAAKASLILEKTLYDISEEQVFASEAYKRNIPFVELRDKGPAAIFSSDEVAAFLRQAETLRANGEGDQACFILRKGERARGR